MTVKIRKTHTENTRTHRANGLSTVSNQNAGMAAFKIRIALVFRGLAASLEGNYLNRVTKTLVIL